MHYTRFATAEDLSQFNFIYLQKNPTKREKMNLFMKRTYIIVHWILPKQCCFSFSVFSQNCSLSLAHILPLPLCMANS